MEALLADPFATDGPQGRPQATPSAQLRNATHSTGYDLLANPFTFSPQIAPTAPAQVTPKDPFQIFDGFATAPSATVEAASQVQQASQIDSLLQDVGWDLADAARLQAVAEAPAGRPAPHPIAVTHPSNQKAVLDDLLGALEW